MDKTVIKTFRVGPREIDKLAGMANASLYVRQSIKSCTLLEETYGVEWILRIRELLEEGGKEEEANEFFSIWTT